MVMSRPSRSCIVSEGMVTGANKAWMHVLLPGDGGTVSVRKMSLEPMTATRAAAAGGNHLGSGADPIVVDDD